VGRTALGIVVMALCASLAFMPAGASDFTLEIFGNANMDDTIDELDIEYVLGIIDGTKDETKLADANNDGEINDEDITQIEQIIAGEETELIVVDFADRIVRVNKPVEQVVISVSGGADAAAILGVKDKVVGVPDYIVKREDWGSVSLFPELAELPSIGNHADPDVEAILSLHPDFVLLYSDSLLSGLDPADPLEAGGIPAIYLDLWNSSVMNEEMKVLGYIFGKRSEAETWIDFCEGYEEYFRGRTDGLSEAEKPKVYLEDWDDYYACGDGGYYDRLCGLVGGKNIASGLKTDEWGFLTIDKEFVIEQNPDIIIRTLYSGVGYATDDTSAMKATREGILSRLEFVGTAISAVEGERCYLHGGFEQMGQHIITTAYFAKWIQPDLFEDLDPTAVHQEYLDTFFKDANFDVYEHGAFVYPPPEEW
jgi:iron complex transport system substrate-binding protein